MRLMLHIVKKDLRRFWWGIAVALLLQIVLAWLGATGNPETLEFSLLLAIAWAGLLALAVHEDPLVGDRQFWITRPGGWRVLLGAKLLFAAAVVHAPSLVASVVVLAARGFRPWEWLGSILARQILIVLALDLPMIALAAVLGNFAYVTLAVVAIAGLTEFAITFTPTLYIRWISVEQTRGALAAAVLAVASAVILYWQFARRRSWLSRFAGIAAILVAELIVGFLPAVSVARVRAAVDPTPTRIAIRLSPNPASMHGGQPACEATIPLEVSGIPTGLEPVFDLPILDVTGSGGAHYQARPVYFYRQGLTLTAPPSICDSMKDQKFRLRGSVTAILVRAGASVSIPLGADRAVPGVGRCFSSVIEQSGGQRMAQREVQVTCESPGGYQLPVFARLLWRSGARGDVLAGIAAMNLLAPLERVETTFLLGLGEAVPSDARLEITPEILRGWQVVSLDLRDIRLADYLLR